MTERQPAERRETAPAAQGAPPAAEPLVDAAKETKTRERSDRGLRNVDTGIQRPAPQAQKDRDRPWLMRTYAGHSTAEASNELYRRNLAKGQTGLSVAFDLPTQTGYDPDHILARGEVGRVGVPVSHLGDMRRLFQDIPLEQMNTSMTINATAMWLLALYQVVAEEQGADITKLQGTTQNDIVKEYLSRGTHVFPPGPSLRLTTDMIAYTVSHIPKWNPINICSYHLQEAGATPVQEIAYAMSTAIAVLDAVRDSGQVPQERMGDVVGRISFFVNAGVRFVEEMCKMRAFGRIWDRITRERYGIQDPKHRRFRYGVQVNSLGLTEAQPENNVQRIVLEMLAVTLSKDARARAVQLPAWNEALGLPRPWDQQWSLRIQQVLAYESDLLEYDDIFEGSKVIETKVAELVEAALAEIEHIQEMGGAMAAVESGYLKSQLVASHAARRARIESGQEKIVGVNIFEGTEPNPLTADLDTAIQTVDPAVEARVIESLQRWRDTRYQPPFNHPRPCKALERLKEAAKGTENLMEATLECARAGVTTGEWAGALREVFGEFRAPTGVSSAPVAVAPEEGTKLAEVRRRVDATARDLGVGKLRFLVGKPGLDGHSNGAEQIAVRARDAGFEVVYQGIRLTPEQIVDAALAEDVHAVGLSILSGSHAQLVPDVLERLREAGAADIPVIAGGIIPNGDAEQLRAAGVAAVFTPKDFDITGIIGRIVDEIRKANKLDPLEVPA
ncbi:protein meaA [Streptomyces cynarae]|uniref:protein meaA n=1 Tax=Streptomyces cynarae TaxID=2981134 RepID=UPI00406BF3FA